MWITIMPAAQGLGKVVESAYEGFFAIIATLG
jgi:hypothetical protein